MSLHGARKIGSLISPLALRELGMPVDVVRLPEIREAWAQAVGELAAHVHPIRYTHGRLVLRADSAVWVSKVRHLHETLTARLRRQPLFRELAGIEVRAAPLERALQRNQPAYRPQPLSEHTRRLLESVAADIDDPGLRTALARLGRRSDRH
jgi:hypothetical protein